MFSCITNYFTYYYNFYFNKPIENTTIPKNKYVYLFKIFMLNQNLSITI